jgi:hypothetical protein
MYCPKCGQPQFNDETSFCSGCGFHLSKVKKLVTQDSRNASEKDEPITRRLVAMAMYILVAILAVTGWGPWSGPEGTRFRNIAIFLSVLTFVLLFSRTIRQITQQLLSGNSNLADSSQLIEKVDSDIDAPPLPPARSIPVSGLNPRRANTAEMAQPNSITEHTTTLLDKK